MFETEDFPEVSAVWPLDLILEFGGPYYGLLGAVSFECLSPLLFDLIRSMIDFGLNVGNQIRFQRSTGFSYSFCIEIGLKWLHSRSHWIGSHR
jgi:hypothetical protein